VANATLGPVVLKIVAQTAGLQSSLLAGAKQVQQFGSQVKSIGTQLQTVGHNAIRAGASIVGALAPVIITGSKFEHQMQAVKAVMGELQDGSSKAAQGFNDIRQAALDLGATTQFTATQVAEGIEELGLAGLDANESLQAIEGTLSLAAAGAIDLSRASEIAVNTLRAFNIAAVDMARVSDVLAVTATGTNTTVDGLGESLSYVTSMASTLGQSIEQVATALGILGNIGLQNSVAGAGLSQMLGKAAANGKKFHDILESYGTTFDKINPEFNSLRDIIAEFERINLSAGDAMELFGARAARMVLGLKNQGVAAFDALNKMNHEAAGAAKHMAEIRMDSLIGDLLRLRAAFETLSIAIYDAIVGSLREWVQWGIEAINIVTEWIKVHKDWISGIFETAAALAAILVGGGAALVVIGSFVALIGGAITLFSQFGTVILAAGGIITGIIAGIAGLTSILVANERVVNTLQTAWNDLISLLGAFGTGFLAGFTDSWAVLAAVISQTGEVIIWAINAFRDAAVNAEESNNAFTTFGYIVGVVCVAALVAFAAALAAIAILAVAANVGLIAVLGIITLLVAGIDALQAKIRGTESFFASIKREAEEATKAVEDFHAKYLRLAEASSRIRGAADEVIASVGKIFGMLENQATLGVVELEELASLFGSETLDDQRDKIRFQLEAVAKEIADLAKMKAAAMEAGEEYQARQLEKLIEDLEKTKAQLNQQLERYETIKEAFGMDANTRADKAAEFLDKQAANLAEIKELRHQIAGAEGEERQKLIDRISLLQEENKELERKYQLYSEINATNPDVDIENADDATAEATERRLEAERNLSEVIEARKDLEKTTAELEEEFHVRRLSSLDKEIHAIEKLREERAKTILEVQSLIEKEKEFIQFRLAAEEKRADSEEKTENIKRYKERLAELNEEYRKYNALLEETHDVADEDIDAAMTKAADKRKDYIRDLEIEELKRSDKYVEAAKLENEKILEEKKKLYDDLFALDGVHDEKIKAERAKAEAADAAAAEARLKEAKAKEEEKVADPVDKSKTREHELELEEDIFNSLAKQAKTVQHMFMLYAAMAKVREFQETRAIDAATRALELEDRLAMLRARREKFAAAGKSTAGIDKTIRDLSLDHSYAAAIARKRREEAGLAAPVGFEGGDPAAPMRDLGAVVETITITILNSLNSIRDAFGAAPTNWSVAFLENWSSASAAIIAAVEATMAAIKVALDPFTRHSPSLVDIWNMNYEVVRHGLDRMTNALLDEAPNIRFRSEQLATSAPSLVSAKVPANRSGKVYTDKRVATINVNNSGDVQKVTRHIGNALRKVGMGTSEGI
jgi:TP901 family phage tail tape measure protein